MHQLSKETKSQPQSPVSLHSTSSQSQPQLVTSQLPLQSQPHSALYSHSISSAYELPTLPLTSSTSTDSSRNEFQISCRTYVSNISFNTRWSELKDFLRQYLGYVGHVEILMHHNGRSKGCAIVEFDSTVHAARAIQVCNGQELNGRKIVFREDRESKSFANSNSRTTGANKITFRSTNSQQRENEVLTHPQHVSIRNSPRREISESFKIEEQSDNADSSVETQLLVSNLPWRTSGQDLRNLASTFGNVITANIIYDRSTGRSKGKGIIQFGTADQRDSAMVSLNRSLFQGRMIFAKEKEKFASNEAGS